jgi:5-methylcytosine-specific restriction endonuclease McrA
MGMTEVDHKDGNRDNNDPANLDELCPMCHKHKGQLAGDYNNQKHNTPASNRQPKGSKIKKVEAFHRIFRFLESDNDEGATNESIKRIA